MSSNCTISLQACAGTGDCNVLAMNEKWLYTTCTQALWCSTLCTHSHFSVWLLAVPVLASPELVRSTMNLKWWELGMIVMSHSGIGNRRGLTFDWHAQSSSTWQTLHWRNSGIDSGVYSTSLFSLRTCLRKMDSQDSIPLIMFSPIRRQGECGNVCLTYFWASWVLALGLSYSVGCH